MKAHGPRAAREAEAAQAIYTPTVLAVYDWVVLGFSSRFVWRCPKTVMLAQYDRNVGARHLDIGVGTGFFLDRCRWPVEHPQLTLLDANPNSLRAASKRTARFRPRQVQADVLEPLDLGDDRFDSVGLSFLLHCLPGPVEEKAATVARNVEPYLAPDAVVFGSTILGRGVRHNRLGRRLMHAYNAKGIFSNREDDAAGLEEALARFFTDVRIEVRGTVALFSARHAP